MKKTYIQITIHGGGSYIQPLNEIHQAIDGELEGLMVGDKITLDFEMVELEQEEYDNLMEFAGH